MKAHSECFMSESVFVCDFIAIILKGSSVYISARVCEELSE